MILADFCRNCLSKWYKAAADGAGLDVSMDEVRERIFGMPYERVEKALPKRGNRGAIGRLRGAPGKQGPEIGEPRLGRATCCYTFREPH